MMKHWLILAIIGISPVLSGSDTGVSKGVDEIQASIQTNASPARILVEPFLSTHWSQWAPYNRFCPTVPNGLSGYAGRTPTGCVPIAMGMILRYYSWPEFGSGTNAFRDTNGLSQGDYAITWTQPLSWERMKDVYSTFCEESPYLVDPLADLLFKLAIAGETNFEADRSGAFASTLARKAGQRLNYTVGDLLSIQDPRFRQVITNEINQRRPVMVNINFEGGHTAIADGLAEDANTLYLHLNFGWGGRNDGWYAGFDVLTNRFFDTAVSTIRPASGQTHLACQPNFFEVVATNFINPDRVLWVAACGATNPIDYAVSSSVPWISINPSSARTSTSAKTPHLLSFNLAELTPGIHDAFVQITGNATNLPRKVGIRVYKPDLPRITLEPEDITTLYPDYELLTLTADPGRTYTPCPLSNPVRYRWFYDSLPLPNETNYWCQAIDFGVYQCEVSSLGGSVRSREIIVKLPPKGIRTSEATLVDGSLQFLLENIQSEQVIIQMSTDLKTWRDAYTFTANPEQSRSMRLNLPLPNQSKTGFFRLKEP